MRLLTEAAGLLRFLLVDDDDLAIDDDARKTLGSNSAQVIDTATAALDAIDEWQTASIETALRAALVDQLGLKPRHAFTPLRVAVTDRRISPPLFESMEILGRASTVARLEALRGSL